MTVVERGPVNGGLRGGAGMDVKKMTFLTFPWPTGPLLNSQKNDISKTTDGHLVTRTIKYK